MENKFIILANCMKENSNSDLGMELAPFIMINKNYTVIKANFTMDLNMVKGIKFSSTVINTQAHFLKINFMVRASTNGKTVPSIKAPFIKDKNMVRVC